MRRYSTLLDPNQPFYNNVEDREAEEDGLFCRFGEIRTDVSVSLKPELMFCRSVYLNFKTTL